MINTEDLKTEYWTSLNIDYKSNASDLCMIGRQYDTDKSSQRMNVSNERHCHPYTLFYDSLFRDKKHEDLTIAELGILRGASLLMWREYFDHSTIYGFEYIDHFINKFNNNHNTNNSFIISKMDVTNSESIRNAFELMNTKYDIIIEDTTHQFEDQIRVIENAYEYLKPGGVLIIEDIFKKNNENDYITRLKPILQHFQDYYFVTLNHKNKNSIGSDNDKLFVLIKGGAEPIFKSQQKITIITPSYRVDNLSKIKESIRFEYVDEWIIVYDGNKITENPEFFKNENNPKIKEYIHTSEGVTGNPQRNYGITQVSNPETYLYFLDDDNLIHPDLYKLLNILDKNKTYTFNQENRLKGDRIEINCIDTAMFLVSYPLCKGIVWKKNKKTADGLYILDCFYRNLSAHIFVDNDLCYYNKLNSI